MTGNASRGAEARLLPVLAWVPGYQRSWLPLDIIAGLTVCAILVPEGMAYAELAGMPPGDGVLCRAGNGCTARRRS